MKLPGNMQAVMKQAEQMQKKLQEEIALIRVEASAGCKAQCHLVSPDPHSFRGAAPRSRVGRPRPAAYAVNTIRWADEGVGCGTGVPPHKTKWHWAVKPVLRSRGTLVILHDARQKHPMTP